MKKYLVILEFSSISNVAIIFAKNIKEAKDIFMRNAKMKIEENELYVIEIDEIQGDFYYY